MAMKKPTRSIQSDAAQAFIEAAASIDITDGKQITKRRPGPPGNSLKSITLLLPQAMLAGIDEQVVSTAMPRLVWIRMAIDNALQAAKAKSSKEKRLIPEGCALLRQAAKF